MTPYELCLAIEVFNEKNQLINEEKLTLTWLGEYYHRVKKLPSLKEVLGKIQSAESKIMTDEQMLKVAQALNVKFGGTLKKSGDE
jgi:hypothetical protein